MRCCQHGQVFHHLSPKQNAGAITLCGTPLKKDEEAAYLAVTFEKRKTLKTLMAKVEAKARRRMATLRKLAETTLKASEKVQNSLPVNSQTHLEYGSTAWSTTAKTRQQVLDKVQNQTLHLITSVVRPAPIPETERFTGAQPLGQRMDVKILMQAGKFRYTGHHPMKTRLEGIIENR